MTWKGRDPERQSKVNAQVLEMAKRVSEYPRPWLKRQRRIEAYWDSIDIVGSLHHDYPGANPSDQRLLLQLARMITEQTPQLKLINEIASHNIIQYVQARYVHQRVQFDTSEQSLSRYFPSLSSPSLSRQELEALHGILRLHVVDVTSFQGPSLIDWRQLSLLALLIQLKNEVDVFLETGHWRIARCARTYCNAFFRIPRMSSKSLFCSGTCRAAAAREQ